jgi:hypothetical protein
MPAATRCGLTASRNAPSEASSSKTSKIVATAIAAHEGAQPAEQGEPQ